MVDYDLGKVVGDKGEQGDDGNGIVSITKTSTSGLVDTYTILFTNGTTTTFEVTNGSSGIADIVTSWSATLHDDKVPSEKLTKNTLDAKLDNAISSTAVTIASNDNILITDYSDSNKVKRVSSILASQMKDSNAHTNIGSSANASQSTINTSIDTALGNKANSSSLSTVATTGSYNDLTNKPSIPTKVSDLQNDAGYLDSNDVGAVALSNDYDDLSNKPTIPSSSSDLSDGSSLVKTSSTTGLLKNDGSVDTNSYLTTSSASSTYQTKLVSGTSIKTINNESLLGSGNISVGGGSSVDIVTSWSSTTSDSKVASEKLIKDSLDGKSDSTHTHGNVNNDGTITGSASSNTFTTFCGISNNAIYKANKFNANNVIDTTAHSNLGTSANATQKDINTAIDSLIGSAITYINGSGS